MTHSTTDPTPTPPGTVEGDPYAEMRRWTRHYRKLMRGGLGEAAHTASAYPDDEPSPSLRVSDVEALLAERDEALANYAEARRLGNSYLYRIREVEAERNALQQDRDRLAAQARRAETVAGAAAFAELDSTTLDGPAS